MSKFHHLFSLQHAQPGCREYTSGDVCARLDFVSESCLRVAMYRAGETLLPSVSVQPDGDFLATGRERLSTQGFSLCEPQVIQRESTEQFHLPCGIEIELDLENFLLSYRQNGAVLFADRAPLAYNIAGEFGNQICHYLTREEGEYIFGLGDKGGLLNKAGGSFRFEATDCMGFDAAQSDPLYKHIPFFICENQVGCYGVFYDTSDTSYIDLGREINNYYPPYKYFKTEDNALVYYVFFGTKLSVLQQFARLCGKQAFAPRWSFDYCASTMSYTDAPDAAQQMNAFLEQLDEYELPCSGFYLSSGYTSIGAQRYVFHWNTDKFPNPAAFVKKFAQHGIHIIPNIKPVLLQSHPLYDSLSEKGCFVKNADGTPYVSAFWDGLGSYLDFTNPETVRFWGEALTSTLLELGIDASWNDNNEFDIKDTEAMAHGFGSGNVPAHRIRPLFTYFMVAASYEAQRRKYPALRPFLSTRSGGIGVRRLAQTWSGDNRTSFEDLRYCHNIGLTLSLSGLPFYGHDLGGFYGKMPSEELLLRWLQHGIFEPRFTIHSWNEDASSTMPWSYPESMPAVKALFAQRSALIPYLYSCAYTAVEQEIPLNAPPLLYYDDPELYAPNDSMMVGTNMLVGFVFEQGRQSARVFLPSAESWYCGKTLLEGGQWVDVPLPARAEVPVFIKAGSVIAQENGGIEFTVYPVKNGSFKSFFFTDDGESFRYLENDCVKLHFSVHCDAGEVLVNWFNEGDMPFEPQLRLCAADERQLRVEQIEKL